MTYRPFSALAWSVWSCVDGSGCFCTPMNHRPLDFPPPSPFLTSILFLFERILNPFCLNIEMAL